MFDIRHCSQSVSCERDRCEVWSGTDGRGVSICVLAVYMTVNVSMFMSYIHRIRLVLSFCCLLRLSRISIELCGVSIQSKSRLSIPISQVKSLLSETFDYCHCTNELRPNAPITKLLLTHHTLCHHICLLSHFHHFNSVS